LSKNSISNRAALFAVVTAFAVGTVGTLAIRPVHAPEAQQIAGPQTQTSPARIAWRLPIVFQTTMPVLGDNPVYLTRMIKAASGGEIDLQIFEPGEIVPAFSITDAVRDGKVSAGYTWLGYDQGKIPASPLVSAVPFGMEPWEYTAWWYDGDGQELTEALYQRYNIHPILCGITGPETAGWFRRKIDSLEDVKGLKIRFAGLGGQVIERLGASVTMLPGGEIFQALEKGAIDATEFALPVVDQSLGFNRVASYNYYPGWHQPFTSSHLVVNLAVWQTLSSADQAMLELGCTAAVTRNLAQAEALQGEVIEGFSDIGVSAEILPEPLLRELNKVSDQILQEEADRDPDFAEILASQLAFRSQYAQWKSRAYLPRDF
jgi:TRAP-type mannitol/chloroaromatic compound transport system substrate-binding protein